MALPAQGSLSYNNIRTELGLQTTAFSAGAAEQSTYVPINQCSTYKPSQAPNCSISEWYGYDHTQPCVAYEFPAVSCDTNVGICDQAFNSSQANQNTSMTVYTGMSLDGDSANNVWTITNASKYTNAYFLLYIPLNGGVSQDPVYEFQGTYTPWNGVANRGTLNGTTVPTGTYYYYIEYNDGSGRTLSGYLYVLTPINGDLWSSDFAYSASSSAAACGATNWVQFAYLYPIQLNKYVWVKNGNEGPNFGTAAPAGYYKRRFTSNWYQVDSSGKVISTGTC
jgi:hypothetical protein